MVVSDPSIDPITGLPVLNPSGPVQQIPLGQEVFPYADLNATAQPTRGPIYGDDIIPTSSLITAPDAQLKPRSIQATTSRELRVREAVFQNLGKAIPDGTTAPVDVNVVSGGGGGGGSIIPINASTFDYTGDHIGHGFSDDLGVITSFHIYSVEWSWFGDNSVVANPSRLWIRLFISVLGNSNRYDLFHDYQINDTAQNTFQNLGHKIIVYPNPLDLTTPEVGGSQHYFLQCQVNLAAMTIHQQVTFRWY